MNFSRLGLLMFFVLGMLESGATDSTNWARTAELSDRQLLKTPKDSQVWADLVEARTELGDYQRAGEALVIWRRNVKDVRKVYPKIEQLQGDLAEAQEDWAGAVEARRVYVRLAPKDPEGWDGLMRAEEGLKDFKAAIAAVTEAIRLEPNADRHVSRGRLRARVRDWKAAAADVHEANKLDASNSEVQKYFPVFERMWKWGAKLGALDADIAKSENKPEHMASALLDRVEVLVEEGWVELAEEDAIAALARTPKSLRAQFWRGALAWRLGHSGHTGDVAKTDDLSKVGAALRKIDREQDPEVRAELLHEQGQLVLAWKQVEAIDGAPVKVPILVGLGQVPKAEEAARRAVELHPDRPQAWLEMARREFNNGNMKETLECLDHVTRWWGKTATEAKELRQKALKANGSK